jgi:hypothetical protein
MVGSNYLNSLLKRSVPSPFLLLLLLLLPYSSFLCPPPSQVWEHNRMLDHKMEQFLVVARLVLHRHYILASLLPGFRGL